VRDLNASNGKSYVLDNTYATKESRRAVIEMGKAKGITVRAVVMSTGLEDCQYNVCSRMIRKHGKLPSADEMKKLNATDPGVVPAAVLYVYRKEYQPPTVDEGFASVETSKFVRVYDPTYTNKALILDYDGCLRETISGGKFPVDPADVRILPRRTEILREYEAKGYLLLGVSNQSGIAKGDLTEATARACFDRTNELLGVKIDYSYCPHRVPPITCYCRKPGPGLGVQFIEKYKLDPRQCIFVGDMGTDKTFAARCGFKFFDSGVFFGDVATAVKKVKAAKH
jgi:HAD superfamily hydrolase (TIGR01662 family)